MKLKNELQKHTKRKDRRMEDWLTDLQRHSRLRHKGVESEPESIKSKLVLITDGIDTTRLNDIHYLRRYIMKTFKFYQLGKYEPK